MIRSILGARSSAEEQYGHFSSSLSLLNSDLTGSSNTESNNLDIEKLWNNVESISEIDRYSSEVKSLFHSSRRGSSRESVSLFNSPFLSLLPDSQVGHEPHDEDASLSSEDSEHSEDDSEEAEAESDEDGVSEEESETESADKRESQIFYTDMYGDEPPPEYHSTDEDEADLGEPEAEAEESTEEKQPPQSAEEAEALLRQHRAPLASSAADESLSSFERLQRKVRIRRASARLLRSYVLLHIRLRISRVLRPVFLLHVPPHAVGDSSARRWWCRSASAWPRCSATSAGSCAARSPPESGPRTACSRSRCCSTRPARLVRCPHSPAESNLLAL